MGALLFILFFVGGWVVLPAATIWALYRLVCELSRICRCDSDSASDR